MDEDRSINSIAKDLPHAYKTVHRISTTMRESIYHGHEEWREVSTGEVEANDVDLALGLKGRTLGSKEASEEFDEPDRSAEAESTPDSEQRGLREPRERGLPERVRGNWSGDRPPAVLWIEQNGSGRRLELQTDVSQRTLIRSAVRHVVPGSRLDTKDFNGYRPHEEVYDHRTLDHDKTYVTDEGIHCNTAEGEWSTFKPWWH